MSGAPSAFDAEMAERGSTPAGQVAPGAMLYRIQNDQTGETGAVTEQQLAEQLAKSGKLPPDIDKIGVASHGRTLTMYPKHDAAVKGADTTPFDVPLPHLLKQQGFTVTGMEPRNVNHDSVDMGLATKMGLPGVKEDPESQQALATLHAKRAGVYGENPEVIRRGDGDYLVHNPQTGAYDALTRGQKGTIGLDDVGRFGAAAPHAIGSMGGAAAGTAAGLLMSGGNPLAAIAGGATGSAGGGQVGDAALMGGAAAMLPEYRDILAKKGVSQLAEEQSHHIVPDLIAGGLQGGITKFLPGLMRSGVASTAAKATGRTAEAMGGLAQDVGGFTARAAKNVAAGTGSTAENLTAGALDMVAPGPLGPAGAAAVAMRAPAQAVRAVPRAAGWLGKHLEDVYPALAKRLAGIGERYGGKSIPEMSEEYAAARAARALRARPMNAATYPEAYANADASRSAVAELAHSMGHADAAPQAEEAFNAILGKDVARQHAAEIPAAAAKESARIAPFAKLLTSAESAANAIDRGIYGLYGAGGRAVQGGGALAKFLGKTAAKGGEIFDSVETPLEIQLGRMSEEKRRRRARALQQLGIPSNMDGKSLPKTQFAAN